jgi:Damage-control phosphatase ARMT1-like domain
MQGRTPGGAPRPPAPRAAPPELLNNDPDGFAWGVWHDRTPRLVRQIRDAHPYGPAQRGALDALLEEVSSGLMQPPGPDEHDSQAWRSWGAEHFGRPWSRAPFLWSESYFYRRLLGAVGFFGPGAWRGVDPFEYLKAAELRDPALGPDLAALVDTDRRPIEEQGQAKLLASLWGNRADLGFRIGAAAGPEPARAASMRVVDDHSPQLWAALGPRASVVLVADNAGRETVADLVLIDHLLHRGHAASVTLHVKPRPYYVSDATSNDVTACLRRLGEAAGGPSQAARRLLAAAAEGRFGLFTHEFYCAPWPYSSMPADLAAAFGQASLTVLKGDLNYRRLVGDRDWPPATPFTDVASYFPGPVAALRTLKSDVITGIDPAVSAGLDAAGKGWRTDGAHALIQVAGSAAPGRRQVTG